MPRKGEYLSHCARGHDLAKPDARLPPRKGRGRGDCRQCARDRVRVATGSPKTGPVNRLRYNDDARFEAERLGLRWCARCKQGKATTDFNREAKGPQGLSFYCRECRRLEKAEAYKRDRDRVLLQKQANTFGVTPDFILQAREAQGNACAICRRPCPSGRALAVDHDHGTGATRGLLCANCNRALGLLQDDMTVVAGAFAYLSQWKAAQNAEGAAGLPHERVQ